MTKVLVVFGKKPGKGQTMHPHFRNNLNKVVELSHKDNFDLIVLSGGQTRVGRPPEAKVGAEYIKNKTNLPLIIEEKARSTSENIQCIKKLVGCSNSKEITLVVSPYHKKRVNLLFVRRWPEALNNVVIETGFEKGSFLDEFSEKVYYCAAWLDPEERYLSRITKRIFRNSDK